MELNELIPAFAAKLGIEGLEVKDGSCSLEIDGIPMEMVEMPEGKAIVVTAIIGPPPLEKTETFFELLLEANTESLGMQAMAFGKLPDSSNLILQWRIPTQNLTLDAFCAELEAFINKVEQWRQALEDFRPAAEKAVIMDEETQLIGMPNSGFISV
ncbi:MAG: type III secretion system chaperone [Victivallales bacterium]|nr:type III secretion system chaperone [Victivallales bacterium]